MIRWSLPKWMRGLGVASETRRYAALSGTLGPGYNETTLGELRRFMKNLERWPDSASVTSDLGSIIQVEFYEAADPLTSGTE